MHDIWGRIFDYPSLSSSLEIAGKTAFVYFFLVLGLRLLGKRELGQMSLYDLVMIIILGNAVQNAMINSDNSLGGGVIAAAVLLLLNRGLNEIVKRSRRAEHLLIGEPVLLVDHGTILTQHMKHEGITEEQLEAALREHGLEHIEQCHLVVLEVDGSMSVIPAGANVLRTKRHYRGIPAAVTGEDLVVQGTHTIIIVAFLLVGFRVFGKRQVAQLNVYDLALLMAASNAVQNAMTAGKGALPSALVTASAVLVPAAIFTRYLARRPALERRVVGTPTVLVHDGQVVESHLRRERVTDNELQEAMRQHNVDQVADVTLAVLEVDGSISVVPRR